MLDRTTLDDPEDDLAGSPGSLHQLLNEFLGLRSLGDKLSDGILQRNEGLAETSSGIITAEQQKPRRKVKKILI